jgi:hypothetical protein
VSGVLGVLACLVGRHQNIVKVSRRYQTVWCRRCYRTLVESTK